MPLSMVAANQETEMLPAVPFTELGGINGLCPEESQNPSWRRKGQTGAACDEAKEEAEKEMSKRINHLGAVSDEAYSDAYDEDEECDQCGADNGFHHEGCIYKCPTEQLHEG